jgi:alpha-mannosidase
LIYLICNAHIDPVWLWRGDEGAGVALSTFRTAADLLDEYPGFIFCHNEALLYQWVEEYDPELFSRIRAFVRAGRWEIIGGWFLQPDVNIPRGESLVRQVLTGRRYFRSRFGKDTETANNFDSFGHARGLVQVLAQCGYKHYLICRPGKGKYDFDTPDFIWKGYDGSEILVHRSDENYNSVLGKVKAEIIDWRAKHGGDTLFLWGVGDHGGGPSRTDLDGIAELIKEGADIKHAVPKDYFDKLDTSGLPSVLPSVLPVVDRGLNRVMEGCYSSQIRVKQRHRRLENDLVMAEIMGSHAAACGLGSYEKDELDAAWRDLLFAEFHDALPGSAIQPVEEDTLRVLDHGLEITSRLKTRYFFALSAGEEKVRPGTTPLLVYNPHPFTVKGPVEYSFLLPAQIWEQQFSNPVVYCRGKRLPGQAVKEEGNFTMDWCKRVAFEAELPPASMSRFDVEFEVLPRRPLPVQPPGGEDIVITSERSRVVINGATGLVDSYQVDGQEYLKKGAFSLDVFTDSFNSWNGPFSDADDFALPLGSFRLMDRERAQAFSGIKGDPVEALHLMEDGEVRATVEAMMEYGDSKACVRYGVNKLSGLLEITLFVFFAESEKRLKLVVPTVLSGGEYSGQTVFGRERLDDCKGEHVSQYWSAVSDGESVVCVLNDGVYGSDYAGGTARLTLLRSAGYGASKFLLGEPFHEPQYQPRMEQGERRYRFVIDAGPASQTLLWADRAAAVLNMPPYGFAYCPSGEGAKPAVLVEIDRDNVSLSCFKRSEDDPASYIVRVFESRGLETEFTLRLPCFGFVRRDTLKPFEIKTYRAGKNGVTPATMLEDE